MGNTHNDSEALVRHSHFSLSMALALIMTLGVGACLLLLWPGSALAAFAVQGAKLLPVMIVILVAVLLRSASTAKFDLSDPQTRAVLNDELRQFGLSRAYRNAFIALLALQPLLACGLTYLSPAYPVALMATLSVTTGAGVMLASVLWYDR